MLKLKDYCTCIGGEKNFTKFFEVKSNSLGECTLCGYYTVSQVDVPNTHGNVNYISKEIVNEYLKRYDNNLTEVGNVLGVELQQIKKILLKTK